GGQQQRVAVARAVVAQPPLLIADEPTGNLDLDTAWEMMDLFWDIAAWGTSVLIATHNVDVVTRLQRCVVTLAPGRLVRYHLAGASDSNPFPASFDVQVKKIDDVAAIDAMVRNDIAVDALYPTSYDRGAYQRIQTVIFGLGVAGFAFLSLLGFVAVTVTINSI